MKFYVIEGSFTNRAGWEEREFIGIFDSLKKAQNAIRDIASVCREMTENKQIGYSKLKNYLESEEGTKFVWSLESDLFLFWNIINFVYFIKEIELNNPRESIFSPLYVTCGNST